ncbi:hypothetical protein CBR_g50478, partial [Chara braunii]
MVQAGGNGDEKRNDIRELTKAIQESATQRDQLPMVEVPLFDGNNASGWAEKFEQLASCREWTDKEMLQKVKRYCKIKYKEELIAMVNESRDWVEFKEKLLDKYQLGDQLLDLADLRKVVRRKFGSIKQFLTEFERVDELIHDLPDKDKCFIFPDNFSEVEQRELMKDMQGRYDWPKMKTNLLAGSFDQMLYRLLKQCKADCEKDDIEKDKDRKCHLPQNSEGEVLRANDADLSNRRGAIHSSGGVNEDNDDTSDDVNDDDDNNGDITGEGYNDGDNKLLESLESPENGDGDDDDDDHNGPQNGAGDHDDNDEDDDEDNWDVSHWNHRTGHEEREDANAGLG